MVLQTHGRSGHYNPHLHIIATSGGLDKESGKWIHLDYLPYPILHKKWQWYLLEMIREELDAEKVDKTIDECYKEYPKGFVANVQKGDVPNRYKSLAKYLAKYVVSPPISVRRIDKYEKGKVIYHYRSHTMKAVKKEKVDANIFIGRMIQHVMPKGFKRIRYYGVQATKSFEKNKEIIKEALLKVKNVVKGAVKIIAQKKYRERYKDITGNDPFICRNCGEEMEIWEIWHPDYGFIYKGYKEIERSEYGRKEQKVFIKKDNGGAIRSSTKGVQLSLFGVWDGATC